MDAQSTKPLLFLNVDGVLTSARTYWKSLGDRGRGARLDQVALSILEQFCVEMDAEVVMASAWSGTFCKNPAEWRNFFAEMGVQIPVVQMLDFDGRSWVDGMEDFMAMFPNRPYVLFEDDPAEAGRDCVIEVDAQVGLTTVDLEKAANKLAPGCKVSQDLARLNKSFSPEQTVTFSVNGVCVEAHPRHVGKALTELGIPPANS